MLLHFFARRRALKEQAKALYDAGYAQAMNAELYGETGIEDSFDGRFDSLLLHLYPLFSAHKGTQLAQQLYTELFKRLELSLREQGVGDMGIQPRMRKMMKAYRGRMEAYENAAKNNAQSDWMDALQRNLFRGKADTDTLVRFAQYAQNLAQLKQDAA